MTTEMKTTCVAPWFGSNRMLAANVGQELSGCSWVGVVFAGGMSELAHISARTLNVNDKHSHVINMARVMAHAKLGPQLYRRLRRHVFHPGDLERAQAFCNLIEFEADDKTGLFAEDEKIQILKPEVMLDWAEAYFVAAWMPRHGSSGKGCEFDIGLSTRWNANGGDSAAHYWSATKSLLAWRKVLQRANFTSLDFSKFLDKCKDLPGHGIYSDAPFPGPGDDYTHTFDGVRQRELARRLASYKSARIVVRFYDVPFIRELYPEPQWTWRLLRGRKQTNDAAPEALIINGPSYAAEIT